MRHRLPDLDRRSRRRLPARDGPRVGRPCARDRVRRERARDRRPVAVEPNYSCGVCPLCREGNQNLCLSRTAVGIDVDGGFAQEVALPARCCWPAPAGVDDDQLLLTEPLAVVVRAVRAARRRRARRPRWWASARSACSPSRCSRRAGAGCSRWAARRAGCRSRGRSAPTPSPPRTRGITSRRRGRCPVAKASTWSSRPRAPRRRSRRPSSCRRPGGRVVLTGLPHEPTPARVLLGRAARDQHPRLDDLPGRVPGGHGAPRVRSGAGAALAHAPVRPRSNRRCLRGASRSRFDQSRPHALTPGGFAPCPTREEALAACNRAAPRLSRRGEEMTRLLAGSPCPVLVRPPHGFCRMVVGTPHSAGWPDPDNSGT